MKLNSFTQYLFMEKLYGYSDKESAYVTLKFAKLLRTDFKEWDAYSLKLIDKDGEILRKPKNKKEEQAFGLFENLVRKIKLGIYSYGGKGYILSNLIGLYLLKKESYSREEHDLKSHLLDVLTEQEILLFESVLMDIKKRNIFLD